MEITSRGISVRQQIDKPLKGQNTGHVTMTLEIKGVIKGGKPSHLKYEPR